MAAADVASAAAAASAGGYLQGLLASAAACMRQLAHGPQQSLMERQMQRLQGQGAALQQLLHRQADLAGVDAGAQLNGTANGAAATAVGAACAEATAAAQSPPQQQDSPHNQGQEALDGPSAQLDSQQGGRLALALLQCMRRMQAWPGGPAYGL